MKQISNRQMFVRGVWPPKELPLALAIASLGCGLAGLAARIGYARNAGGAIRAVTFGTPAEAHRLAALAEWCSLAQMILGLLAVGLAWYVWSRASISGLARLASGIGLALGVGVLLLVLLLV
jgi:hypothetical protein